MKILFSLLICFYSGLAAQAQDINTLIREAYRLESVPDEKAALAKFRDILKINPANIQALNKCSELCSRIGQRETENTKLRDEYYLAAKTYAELALKTDPKNSDSNCAMAIALGRATMSKSGKEKIAYVREIKKHADIAIYYDHNNFKAWHVLGRWHFEISNLNALERSMVRLFYGGLPPASYDLAIQAFERARSIRPEFVLNYFEMAKAYKDNNNRPMAVACLKQMLNLPNQTEDDPEIKAKARQLIRQWQ